jgi:hypothetical protein
MGHSLVASAPTIPSTTAEVVNTRLAGTGLRVEADLVQQTTERPMDVLVEEPLASQGKKKGVLARGQRSSQSCA